MRADDCDGSGEHNGKGTECRSTLHCPLQSFASGWVYETISFAVVPFDPPGKQSILSGVPPLSLLSDIVEDRRVSLVIKKHQGVSLELLPDAKLPAGI